jgi:hypothetical protein
MKYFIKINEQKLRGYLKSFKKYLNFVSMKEKVKNKKIFQKKIILKELIFNLKG